MKSLIPYCKHLIMLVKAGIGAFTFALIALASSLTATSSHAAVNVFFSAGSTCTGGSTTTFVTSGGTVQVSLCVTNTGEAFGLCGHTTKLRAAAAGENGRFNITARTLGSSYPDANNTTIPFPIAVNSVASANDLGGTSTTGAPVAPAANQLLATFDLSPQANATNASYVLSTSSDAILSVDTDNTCLNPTDLAVSASMTLNRISVPDAPTIGTATAGNTTASVAFTAPMNTGGSAITGYTATCGAQSNTGMTSPIVVSGLTNGTPVTCTVVATNAVGNSVASAASNSVTPVAPQVITFGVAPTVQVSGTGTVSATGGGSGNPVTFSSTTLAVCTVTGSTVTGVSAGSCTIAANQGGSAAFSAAPQVTQTFTVTAVPTFVVTPSAGANGTISPAIPVNVNSGATTQFTVTPNANYTASVGGTCGGTLVGNTYTTNAITGACTVSATFTLNTYAVTPSAGANGTISPNTVVNVGHGLTTQFTVTPSVGYTAVVGGTCGGTLVGNTYTTNTITGACTVSATFTQNTYAVTPSAGANGTISPNTVVNVGHGLTTAFTVTPNANYTASVGGTCGGTLVGNTYTTNTITGACTVSATFTPNLALTAVQSRKTHGAAGTFDLPISTTPTVTGLVSTEPRVIGSGHTVVFQFNQAITNAGTVTLTDVAGNPIGSAVAAIGTNTSEVVVTITGVTNARVLVSLTNVTAATGMVNASAAIGFMQGDVSANRATNASDVVAVRNRVGQATTAANARYDLNASGTVDAADEALVKATSGTGL
jgi:hypothetical protein